MIQEVFYPEGMNPMRNEVYRNGRWFSLENSSNNDTEENHVIAQMIYDSTTQSVFITGSFCNTNGIPSIRNVAKYDTIKHTWDSLDYGINSFGMSLDYDPSKRTLFVGGVFSNVGPETDKIYVNNIARFDCINKKWSPLKNGLNSDCICMAYNPITEHLFVGGNFTMSGPISLNYIGMYDVINNVWKQIPGGDINGICNTLCLDVSNQLLYIGGNFTEVGHSKMTVNHIAVYDIATDTWWELNGGIHGVCKTMCLDSINQQLFIGGSFSSIGRNKNAANNVAVFDISSKKWDSLSGGVNHTCNSLIVDQISRILYVGGSFTDILFSDKKESCPYIAKYDISRSLWSTFSENIESDEITNNNVGINGPCKTICMNSNHTRIYAGGLFSKIGDMSVCGMVGYKL
jgi:hypothetical protein